MKGKAGPKKTVIAYVPVLHEGYRRFFEKHAVDAEKLILIGPDITKDFKPLVKDIRALPPEIMKTAIDSLKHFKEIKVADYPELDSLNDLAIEVTMPDEDVMHELAERHFPKAKVVYDSVFLRWDRHKSFEGKAVGADQTVSENDTDIEIISLLKKEAEKSPDFWRQIGAAIVKDGKVISKTHNEAVPDKMMPYVEGDPRSDFSKGVNIELSTSFHSEARLIAQAAEEGVSLKGAEMYATTFPCPPCAKLVAYSGIKKLYYADGYGVLDGERVLRSRGVKIIFVKIAK